MTETVKKIAITGAAGHIAYQLLFRIASGELLGKKQKVALHLLEIPEAQKALEGVVMELEDGAFPLINEIKIGSDPNLLFDGIDFALLVGAKPRGPGMERVDLLQENGAIFVEQGRALNNAAKKETIVLVIGNPCNTNCLIAMSHAPKIPRKNFHALTRLDQNRSTSLLAKKANSNINSVNRVTIWGNHSGTQVPDFYHVTIDGRFAIDVIGDERWLQDEFVRCIRNRGAEIIAARGKSSAASAANAVVDAIHSLMNPTPEGQWFSSAVCSDQNTYGIEENLIFSFPCRSYGNGEYEIVPDLDWDDYLRENIRISEKELLEEREMVVTKLPVKERTHG